MADCAQQVLPGARHAVRGRDKRRTDTSDTPVSESVDGAWSGHAGGGTRPPEKMIREMAETGGEPAEVSRESCDCDCDHHRRAGLTLKNDKIDDGRRIGARSCRAGKTRGGLIGVINP